MKIDSLRCAPQRLCVLVVGSLLASLALAQPARAGHSGAHILDVSPESGLKEVGSQHTLRAIVSGLDDPLAAHEVDFEFLAGSPHDVDGTTPLTPDASCTAVDPNNDGVGQCTFAYTSNAAGRDTVVSWVDDDGLDATPDGDFDEGVNADSDPGLIAEPDDTDVVRQLWFLGVPESTTLQCNPETAVNPVGGPGSVETYTCVVALGNGEAVPGVRIDVENLNGANDPDNSDGSEPATTNSTPDFNDMCITGGDGRCQISIAPTEGEAGDARLCFWVDEDFEFVNDYQPLDVQERDGGACDEEPRDETASPSADGPLTEVVRKTWKSGTGEPTIEKIDSNVTIRGSFRGRVTADSYRRCRANRLVTLRKVRPGRDRVLGRDTTGGTGGWRVEVGRADGRYYARVARKQFTKADGTVVICRAARSRVVRR